MEIWKQINGFNNYEVSNYGNVRSLDRKIPYIQRNQYGIQYTYKILSGKNLTPRKTKAGYFRVQIEGKDRYIHRLVAEHFIGNIDKLEINHIDGIKSNNNVTNLEIATRIKNQNHAVDNKLNITVDKAISVIVNGNFYNSLGEASRSENIPICVLHNRLKNPVVNYTGNHKYRFTISRT